MYGKTNAGAPTGGIEMVKLWENASPTSGLAAQTLNFNIPENATVFIYCVNTSRPNDVFLAGAGQVGDNVILSMARGQTSTFDGFRVQNELRSATITANGITFGSGYYFTGSAFATANAACSPVKITMIGG